MTYRLLEHKILETELMTMRISYVRVRVYAYYIYLLSDLIWFDGSPLHMATTGGCEMMASNANEGMGYIHGDNSAHGKRAAENRERERKKDT